MALVVFLRGVNVGGHKSFQPSAIAQKLPKLDLVNIGAAGTFVIRKPISQTKLRAELGRALPFEAELMICTSRDLLALEEENPLADEPASNEVKHYVTVLAKRPAALPAFPFSQPAGDSWQVKVVGIVGRFVFSLHRRQEGALVYPNPVIEKKLAVSATTRNWNTIKSICDILKNKK